MVKSRVFLLVALGVVCVTVGSPGTLALPRAVPPSSKVSQELEVVIKLLREGAAADPNPDIPPDLYAVSMLWDTNVDPTTMPAGCGHFTSFLKEKNLDQGPLNYAELWRVWGDLIGITGNVKASPITQAYEIDVGYFLLFSRQYSSAERVSCANSLIARLTERYRDHQQYQREIDQLLLSRRAE